MRKRLLLSGVVVLVLALGAAACGDDSSDTSTGGTGSSTTAGASSAGGSEASAAGGTEIKVSTVEGQDIITDDEGVTLYAFKNDTAGKSVCNGNCATLWPPLTTTGAPSADSEVSGEVSSITRDDGTEQVTLDDQPLYYYETDDKTPGSTAGQAVGGIWFVLGPDGKTITTPFSS
jgi:predicted lipoprotein with Yx(FWY)xxD motif